MYYRDDGGLGCLIGIFIILILLSAVMAIILSPIFWIVVGILVLFQAISNRWGSHRDWVTFLNSKINIKLVPFL